LSQTIASVEDLTRALAWHALIRTGGFDPSSGARAEGAVPLVYVDKNPWGRQHDDPSVARNVEEAAAFASLVDLIERGLVRLAYSSVSFGEGEPRDGSVSASRLALRGVIGFRQLDLPLIVHDERADTEMTADHLYRSHGIAGYDAIHAAASLLEGAWYFVTGDDRLRRRLSAMYASWSLPTQAETPVTVIRRLDRGAPLEG
jgi:hypothetical protein